jgi:peptidoglycan/xylan/chitin deacetylase (PgdA/CDA1 family)
MDPRDAQARRLTDARKRKPRAGRARFAAIGSLVAVAAVAAAIVSSSGSGPGSPARETSATHSRAPVNQRAPASGGARKPGTATVPILAYRVINVRPPGSSASPALYVPSDEFSAQMDALKAAGWQAVTLNQLQAHWTRGVSLGSEKPIVITFDGGYASQYTNALPILKRLGWVGVGNIQVSGLPPSEGGLTDHQIRGLIAAGWELDLEGDSQPDPTSLDASQLHDEIATGRQALQSRYGIPVNWYAYPSGRYNSTVTAAVRSAGFVGATTVVPGWASPQGDRYRLPRLQVTGGTSPTELLTQITSAQQDTSVPVASAGT